MDEDIRGILRRAGAAADDAVDLAGTALALAALERPRVPLGWYRSHLAQLAGEVGDAARTADGVAGAAAALRRVVAERHGYCGDAATYDDQQNANLMRVMDRRKGLPVALGILYIHAARAQDWRIAGLGFPGHFLIRLDRDGERAILDPFDGARQRGPADLRDLLKAMIGADAELRPDHYATVGDREVLLRLQNNIKVRHLRARRFDQVARVVDAMLLIAPGAVALWREAGLLNAQLGNLGAAIDALGRFIEAGPDDRLRHEAATLVQRLKASL